MRARYAGENSNSLVLEMEEITRLPLQGGVNYFNLCISHVLKMRVVHVFRLFIGGGERGVLVIIREIILFYCTGKISTFD